MDSGNLHATLQSAVLREIASVQFQWPDLSKAAFSKVYSPQEYNNNDRIEFVGDALMSAVLALIVQEHFPYGTAGQYTKIAQVLASNLTFYHFTHKPVTYTVRRYSPYSGDYTEMDIERVPRSIYKKGGDVFETIVGYYYRERGFEALVSWARPIFDPLVAVADEALQDYRRLGAYANQYAGKRAYEVEDKWQHRDKRARTCEAGEQDSPHRPLGSGRVFEPSQRYLASLRPTPSTTTRRTRAPSRSRSVRPTLPSVPPPLPLHTHPEGSRAQLADGAVANFGFTFHAPLVRSGLPGPATPGHTPASRFSSLLSTPAPRGRVARTPTAINSPASPVFAPTPPSTGTSANASSNTVAGPSTKAHLPPPPDAVVYDLTDDSEYDVLPAHSPAVESPASGHTSRSRSPTPMAVPMSPSPAPRDGSAATDANGGLRDSEMANEADEDEYDGPRSTVDVSFGFGSSAGASEPVIVEDAEDEDDRMSTMDVSFGCNTCAGVDGLAHASAGEEDNEDVEDATAMDVTYRAAPHVCGDDDDDDGSVEDARDKQEVESLLQWIMDLGPAVDKLDVQAPPTPIKAKGQVPATPRPARADYSTSFLASAFKRIQSVGRAALREAAEATTRTLSTSTASQSPMPITNTPPTAQDTPRTSISAAPRTGSSLRKLPSRTRKIQLALKRPVADENAAGARQPAMSFEALFGAPARAGAGRALRPASVANSLGRPAIPVPIPTSTPTHGGKTATPRPVRKRYTPYCDMRTPEPARPRDRAREREQEQEQYRERERERDRRALVRDRGDHWSPQARVETQRDERERRAYAREERRRRYDRD